MEPVIESVGYRFTVKMATPKDMEVAKSGTRLAGGGNFGCLMSGTPMNPQYIKAEGVPGLVYLDPTPEPAAAPPPGSSELEARRVNCRGRPSVHSLYLWHQENLWPSGPSDDFPNGCSSSRRWPAMGIWPPTAAPSPTASQPLREDQAGRRSPCLQRPDDRLARAGEAGGCRQHSGSCPPAAIYGVTLLPLPKP